MQYGILNSSTNTGIDSELAAVFSAPISISSNQPAFGADTLSLKRSSASTGAQRWEITAAIAPSADSVDIMTNMLTAGYGDFMYVRMPQLYRNGKQMPTGLSLTAAGTPQGSDTVNISGANGNLMKGEFIKFASHAKIYMIVDPGVDGVGARISPRLIAPVTTGTAVKYGGEVTMRCKYELDTVLGLQFTDGILSSPGQIKVVEAL